MHVVTRAMSTIIANSVGEITPSSSPMFRTTSSMSPRVFISAPNAVASRHGVPVFGSGLRVNVARNGRAA